MGYQIRSNVNKSDDHAEYVALMDEVLNERGGGGNENDRESIANDNNVAAAAAAAAEDHDDDATNNKIRRRIHITEQQIRQIYDEYLRGENYSHYVKPTPEQLGRGAIFLLNAWLEVLGPTDFITVERSLLEAIHTVDEDYWDAIVGANLTFEYEAFVFYQSFSGPKISVTPSFFIMLAEDTPLA